MKVVVFSRVSTLGQENFRQTSELLDFAKSMNWDVVKVFEEKMSGALKNEDRPILQEMIQFIKSNNISKVICWELSRIGRNSIQVLQTIEMLNQNKISLYIKNYSLETLNDNGEVNPMSQFMVQILTSVSEMERLTIRQRMKSGYEQYVKAGGKVGRKVGFKKDNSTILHEYKDVVKLIKQGYSIRQIMKLTDRSSGTIMKLKK